jgi:photosystem II stability/assembly factor-like uncharacterized protein
MKHITTVVSIILFFTGSLKAQSVPNSSQEGPQQGWYKQQSGVTGTLSFVSFISRDTGWAGEIWTTNGGETWKPYNRQVMVVRFLDKKFGYGYSEDGINDIATTTNGGETWNHHKTNLPYFNTIYFSSPLLGFSSTNVANGINRTTDGGKTWSHDPHLWGDIQSFAAYDSLHIIASGGDFPDSTNFGKFIGGVFASNDGGETWHFTMKKRQQEVWYQVFAAFNPSILYFLCTGIDTSITGTRVHKSKDGGLFIPDCPMPDGGFSWPTKWPAGGFASDVNNVTVVGGAGLIFRTCDGQNWIKQNSGTAIPLEAVCFVDSMYGWAVGDGGIIIHTVNGGFSSASVPTHLDSLHVDVIPNPSNEILTLNYTLPIEQHITITLLDIAGHSVSTPLINMVQPIGVQSIPIDVHSIPSGTYFLHLQSEKYQSVINCSVIH